MPIGFSGFRRRFAPRASWFFGFSLVAFFFLGTSQTSLRELQAPLMTKEELKPLLGKPDLVVIDVRLEEQWKFSNRKIPGAIHENPSVPDMWIEKVPKDKTVVLYCA